MSQSEQINELAAALSKAQAKIKPAALDGVNPHFHSKYATLASILDAIREPLTENGLAISQTFLPSEPGFICVRTLLMHSSGQWIEGQITLTGGTPQQCGSSATYARRYSLAAIIGVAAEEDDDGNATSQAKQPPARQTQQRPAAARQAAAPDSDVWPGPGQCPKCHAPEGKRHGKPCIDTQPATPKAAPAPANEPTATAAQFNKAAIERGYGDYVSQGAVQAFIEEIAPDYAGRSYKQLTGRDWAILIDCLPEPETAAVTSETPYSDGEMDPFADD